MVSRYFVIWSLMTCLVSCEMWFTSEVPRELVQQARGGEVSLNLEDHRHEDYVKPRTVVRAFAGEGHRLGWYDVYIVL